MKMSPAPQKERTPKMIKTLRSLVLAHFLIVLPAAAMAASSAYKLRVDGLACPFCAYGVEKKLSAIKDVKAIAVDIKSGTVTVTMTDDATLDEATAKTAVEAAGFNLGGFEEVPAAARERPKQ